MLTQNKREDWRWLSLFDPETTNDLPAVEGGFAQDYEVEEGYTEGVEQGNELITVAAGPLVS